MKEFQLKNIFFGLEANKIFLAAPFFIIFLANIFITQVRGLEYAGRLAVFAGISSFLAIILSLRWDSEILVKPLEKMISSLESGILTVLSLFLLILTIFFLLGLNLDSSRYLFLLVTSGALIALYELFLNSLLKVNNIKKYILFRLIPPVLLFLISFNGSSEEIAWLFSFLIPTVFLLASTLEKFSLIEIRMKALLIFINNSKDKIIPTISSLISNSIPLLWLLIVSALLGEAEAGIWINAYRIFSLPVAFCGAVILPFVLASIGDQNRSHKKFSLMSRFNLILLIIAIITVGFSSVLGQASFSFLIKNDISIDRAIIFSIIAISFMQYSLQYWKEVYQSINRTKIFFFILVIELLLGSLIYFFYTGDNIKLLVLTILLVTILPYSLAAILTIYLGRVFYRSEV